MTQQHEYQITKQRMKDLMPGQAYPNITTQPGWRLHSIVPVQSTLAVQGFSDYLLVMEREVAEAPSTPVKLDG